MKLCIDYIDNAIEFIDDNINVMEIENKKYFYRLVNDLNDIANGQSVENIKFFTSNFDEEDYSNKIKVVSDYFNIEMNDRRIIGEIEKFIIKNTEDNSKKEVAKYYAKIRDIYSKISNSLELPLKYSEDVQYDKIIKNIGFYIENRNDLIDNLLLLIDIEKTFKINKLIVFVNLKQYLNENELIELYKYSIYNNVNILLIDTLMYKKLLKYEKKFIIDNDLDEYVL